MQFWEAVCLHAGNSCLDFGRGASKLGILHPFPILAAVDLAETSEVLPHFLSFLFVASTTQTGDRHVAMRLNSVSLSKDIHTH